MSLPEAMEDQFDARWEELEREQTMAQAVPPIIRRAETRGEPRGEQRGELKGKRDALIRLMQSRFGPLSAETRQSLEQISDSDQLDALIDVAANARSVAEVAVPQN